MRIASRLVVAGSLAWVLTGVVSAEVPDLARLQKMTARFAPVEIKADVSKLPENERRALAKIVEAARIMDPLFLRQSSAANEAWLLSLLRDESPLGKGAPPLLPDQPGSLGPTGPRRAVRARRRGPSPSPATSTPPVPRGSEMDAWMKALSGAEKEAATGFFTTIRRGSDGRLAVVPYSLEYQGELARASELLREAAAPHDPAERSRRSSRSARPRS